MKLQLFLLLALLCIATCAKAQTEGTLTLMNSLPQVVINNPAIVPKYKIAVGLPGSSVMAFYSNNGFTYNDLIKHQNDSVKVDLPKLSSSLKPKNYITQALQFDLLRLGYKVNSKLYVTLSSTAKVYNRLMVPKDLMSFFIDGNSALVGKDATLSPKAESITMLETALGGSYQVDNNLTIGGRIKFLKGITNVTTESASLNLATNSTNYGLTASASMDVRTSGIYNFSQSGFNFGSNINNYLSNTGVGIDIGATYRVLDRLTLGASLIDIGTVHWKNNTYGYSLDPTKATYNFPGVDLVKVVNGNSNYLNSLGDTLQNKFHVKEGAISAYNTPTPGKLYLSGMYEVVKDFTVGGVFFSEKFRGRFTSGITLGVNKHFGRIFSASGSYSIASNAFNNLGAGFSLNLAPVQLYLVGDNLLRMPLAGDLSNFINSTKYFNARLGLNFVWGWEKGQGKKEHANPSTNEGSYKRKLYKNYSRSKVRRRR